jgi:hypothetical protein
MAVLLCYVLSALIVLLMDKLWDISGRFGRMTRQVRYYNPFVAFLGLVVAGVGISLCLDYLQTPALVHDFVRAFIVVAGLSLITASVKEVSGTKWKWGR